MQAFEEKQVNIPGLETMALLFDNWREYDKRTRDSEGLETTDDTYIMCPPTWPSHGQLDAWSNLIRDAIAALDANPQGEG